MTLRDTRSIRIEFGSAQSLEAKRLVELGAELAAARYRFELEFDMDLENAPPFIDWNKQQIRDEIATLERLIAANRVRSRGWASWLLSLPLSDRDRFVGKFNKWPDGLPEEEV